MKIKERAITLLLSLVMVITFMPALAFAEGEEPADANDTPTVEEPLVEAPGEKITAEEADDGAENSWFVTDWYDILYTGSPVTLKPEFTDDAPEGLSYQWFGWNGEWDDNDNLVYSKITGATGKSYSGVTADDYFGQYYYVEVTDAEGEFQQCYFNIYVEEVITGSVYYYATDAMTCEAEVDDNASGVIDFIPSVSFPDGKSRTLTRVWDTSVGSTACNIPASVSEINFVGLGDLTWGEDDLESWTVKPGFTIYGETGSAAQAYANEYGVTFIDISGSQPPYSGGADWHADNVAAIQFIPVGGPERFTFYQDSNPNNYYWCRFKHGDKIIATLTDGSKKTLIYKTDDEEYGDEEAIWWIQEDQKELGFSYVDDNGNYGSINRPYIYAENISWSLGNNKLYVSFGTNSVTDEWGNTITEFIHSDYFYGTLKDNPVDSIIYRPAGTSAEIAARFTLVVGLDYYFIPFEVGDKLIVVINGQRKEYVYDAEEGEFCCEGQYLPTEYGYLHWEGLDETTTASWIAGNDYYVSLVYGSARSFNREVHVIENPVDEAMYIPAKGSISEARMRMYEREYEEGEYEYFLDLSDGDRLVVLWKDGETTEYVCRDYEFFDEDGILLPYDYDIWEGSWSCDIYDDHITAGLHDFHISYLGKEIVYKINVTESEYEEFELVDFIVQMLDYLDDLDENIVYRLYREAQQDELEDLYFMAKNAILNAESMDEVDAALTAYERAVAKVKTDAQMREEEAAVLIHAATVVAAITPAAPLEYLDLPAVKISKPAAAKKKLTVKWKKVNKKNLKKISGIQIQVATDPGFTNIVKTATVGKKKTSKKIGGLQPKTKYYVRIRAYGAANHFSIWKSKSAKVK